MATNVTLVTLPQMVDLALNCHEGIINFQCLHTLLMVTLQRISLVDVAVEFRGEDSDRIQALIATSKPLPSLYPQYQAPNDKTPKDSKDKKKPTPKKKSLQDVIKEQETEEEKKERELRVIERRKDSKEDPDLNPLPLKSPTASILGVKAGDLQTIVVLESQTNLPQYSVAVSKSIFDEMQSDITKLKSHFKELTDLPSNMGLIEATKTSSGPIVDMFQILNLTKRMDANEIALEKMGSLIEDIVKNDGGDILQKVSEVKEAIEPGISASRRSSLNQLDERVTTLEKAVEDMGANIKSIHEDVSSEEVVKSADKVSVSTQEDTGSVAKAPKQHASKGNAIKIFSPQKPFSSALKNVDLGSIPVNEALVSIQKEFNGLKNWMTESIQEVDKKIFGAQEGEGEGEGGAADLKIIDSKFKEYSKQMDEMNALYNNQIQLLNDQFTNVQHDMHDVITKMEIILPGGDSSGINAETTMDLANKLELLEKEIVSISDQAAKLREEKEAQDKQTSSILEQIDVLKIVKANREDLEDALGDKADACLINRKVSHDQFDAACDDLTRGIEDALGKLQEQEEMWHQALDSIQKEIGNKLDKMEVDPLRDFVNNKLKALQDKFKVLAALKREQEAAGTKTKLLRDVNCISCDKDVVMKREMDASLRPKAYAMPPSRSMAPYLAYELDQLRKQQKCVPGSKNLNFIESALKSRGVREKDHICNRYCGGSHTVTTPQQRVTRLGHFLEQWGPEIAPINDEYIKGTDKQMYKARDESLYKKAKGEEPGKKGLGAGKEPITPGKESEIPQQDNLTNADTEQAVAKDVIEKNAAEKGTRKKNYNIGSEQLTHTAPAVPSSESIEFKPPLGSTPKTSQTKAAESQPPKSSTPKTSQTKAAESQPPKPSTPKTSQTKAAESQPPKPSTPKTSQTKAAESQPPKPSTPKTSQTKAAESQPPKTSQTKATEPQPPKSSTPKTSQTKVAESQPTKTSQTKAVQG